MSRAAESNDRYILAFGVDHTPMGCFFQLFETAAEGENPEGDEMDQPQIDADEMYGIRVHNPKTLERNPTLGYLIPKLTKQSLRNEETIIEIGKACGLDVAKRVYELWD